jgi:hypothetical protein
MAAMSQPVEVVEVSPIKAVAMLWRPQNGKTVLTLICKATFKLAPGVAELAEIQDDVNVKDLHAENNPSLGLHSASDMAPYKARADVTVVGKCYAPPHELSRALVARVKVGTVDKRVEVHAERYLQPNGAISDDKFFTKMPIGYERAPGGPHTQNPVGMSLTPKDGEKRVALPNLQVVGEKIAGPGAQLTPVGFGPIPAKWPSRAALAAGRSVDWLATDSLSQELPADWNWAFFNVAPRDQQLAEIKNDETIVLQHLHPSEAALETRLPGIYPCVYMEQAGEAHRVQMKADTLWIDTNRLVHTVTWRAQVPLASVTEPIRVLVAKGEPDNKPTWDAVWAQAEAKKLRARAAAEAKPTRVEIKNSVSSNPAPASMRGLTSPIPLVPTSDHTPGWLPAVSSQPVQASIAPSDGLLLELALSDAETKMLRELCGALGYDTVEMVRHTIREAHHARFGGAKDS